MSDAAPEALGALPALGSSFALLRALPEAWNGHNADEESADEVAAAAALATAECALAAEEAPGPEASDGDADGDAAVTRGGWSGHREPGAAEQFPRFEDAEPLTFKLEAGEILFIPVHWWHVTRCPGFQLNVTCFWGANIRQYTFPEPAFQVFAREAIWQTKTRWNKAKSRLRGN